MSEIRYVVNTGLKDLNILFYDTKYVSSYSKHGLRKRLLSKVD